jgi:hypothetical protein
VKFFGAVVFLCAAMVLGTPTVGHAQDSAAQSREDKMLDIIKRAHVGDNLGNFAAHAIQVTQTYRTIVMKEGAEKAEEIVRKELAASLPKYQDQWDRNLAATYLEYYTPEEVESIFKDKEASPYAKKYLDNRENVGVGMQKKSQDLMTKLCSEVLNNSLHDVAP